MGWFWGSSNTNGDDDGNKDPLRSLDPSLREFLRKESPVKYSTSAPPALTSPATTTQSRPTTQPQASQVAGSEDTQPKVPPQSLFQDGRYADLWKTYQPLEEIEAAGKTDQDKIMDILEGYKYRRAEIGRAALENCAMEQWDVNDCFRNGGWQTRLTMCRAENKKLERCYTMQAKFLKALGYLSTFDRSPEVNEQIQMRADTLYHRMMEQERQIEAAKAEGKPVPKFAPLITAKTKLARAGEKSFEENLIQASDLRPSVQAHLKKRLEGLSDEERRVEEMAIKAEIQVGEQVAGRLGTLYEKQDNERKKRQEEGKATLGDKLWSIFGAR